MGDNNLLTFLDVIDDFFCKEQMHYILGKTHDSYLYCFTRSEIGHKLEGVFPTEISTKIMRAE